MIMLIFMYITLVVHLLVIICIYIAYNYVHGKKKTSTQDYVFSILNLYGVASRTILPIPAYNLFFAFIFCDKTSPIHQNFQCFSGTYYIHFGSALLAFPGAIDPTGKPSTIRRVEDGSVIRG